MLPAWMPPEEALVYGAEDLGPRFRSATDSLCVCVFGGVELARGLVTMQGQ